LILTAFLKEHKLRYIPVGAGLFVFAQLAPRAKTWTEETAMVNHLKEAGVIVSSGKAYHGLESEKGWARVSFAIPQTELLEALRRMKQGLGLINGTSKLAIKQIRKRSLENCETRPSSRPRLQ
jgi:DNA-binding transcriptional MocR family regulator